MANKVQHKHSNNNKKKGYNPDYKPKTNYPTAITYTDGITVGELAEKLERNSSDVIKVLFLLGKMVTINSPLEDEDLQLVCMEFNVEATKEEYVDPNSLEDNEVDDEKDLENRPPIVTIMGHVDHGKTTLLDYIRNSHVTNTEFGGITQHIGAYQVSLNNKKITFIDTPGHEAFTAMRARGAKVTDLVIIVVAADDGVMPQTVEAIDHAKAAGCPIIVAVNKMDKPNVNPDKIMNSMADHNLMPEEWGGDTIFCKVSAKTGLGVDELLETINVVSEVSNLRANPKRCASGTVIEAKLDKGRGPVATVLVQNGTLRVGDPIVIGACFGKIRRMTNDKGLEIKEAGPSTPVEIIGLNDVPIAGDLFKAFRNEKQARDLADKRAQAKIESERKQTSALTLDDLSAQIAQGDVQEIPVIVKADVTGSAEAVKSSLEKVQVGNVKVNVIRSTAGAISESDIMLASASHAIIYGFNVRPDANVKKKAAEEKVEIRLHNIIYKLIEEIEAAMKGMLAPVYEEQTIGQAEVRQLFKVSKVGTICGCMVTEGKIVNECKIRLIRDGIVIYTGKLGSLQRFKNSAKEVAMGYECGLTIENYNDEREGDVIEAYADVEVEE